MENNSLIANSGIHFKITYLELNSEESFILRDGKTLKYTFIEKVDFVNKGRIKVDVCSVKDGKYSPVNYLETNNLLEKEPNGLLSLDENGIPQIQKDTIMTLIESYDSSDNNLMSITSLSSLRFNNKTIRQDGSLEIEQKTGFEMLLGKWLPMPMYEFDDNGYCLKYPNGWCRVRIDMVGDGTKKGYKKYRLVWAFDTRLAQIQNEYLLRPSFLEGSGESKIYSLCNRVDLLLGNFLTIPDGQNDAPIGDYIVSLWNIDLRNNIQHKYKFIAYYIYIINLLRVSGAAPVIKLYNKEDKQIPVDMSIDIGNSRTCAVLFENGNFTKARMLKLRDLSEPWKMYDNAFDMRVVFRKADFGGDLTQDKNLFQWQSLVRVGEEAKHLIYHSIEGNGESEKMTNYSSPKRYLWDDRLFENKWELMVEEDDPTNIKVNPQIFMEGFTEYFDNDGSFLEKPKGINLFTLGQNNNQCHYSRRSLMTFIMIEILQHALCYINSSQFREMHGSVDCRRYLRNIIVTCPTAMPLREQEALRNATKHASFIIRKLTPVIPDMTIIPDPDKILKQNSDNNDANRGWLYDEAFASQLVYLYAELSKRYGGRVDHFIQLKGHPRKEVEDYGLKKNALTIGTIDIGAGTTDVMITIYGQKGQGKLLPIPVYYDSFYSAGDDILHNIIRDVIIEGSNNELPQMGSIESALTVRILKMSPDEMLKIPRIEKDTNYTRTVEDIRNTIIDEDAKNKRYHLIQELMNHFFGENSAGKSEKDRKCRLDFCTQISHPMSQFFLELLKQGRPTRVYTYDEIFNKDKPAKYLLKHFEEHFGFRFEELSWRYDPEMISDIVRSTMGPLVKTISEVLYKYHCDILVLSGRPTNLKPLIELFLENIPVAPNRMVCLNQYRVGSWFPLATEEGYFQENQKAVVAVGAEVGYMASTTGFNGLVLDFSVLEKEMQSTARFIGLYDENLQEVKTPLLTPQNGTASLKGVSVFPCYLGCKQFDSPKYQARPLYAIYNNSGKSQLNILLQRNYFEDREQISISDASDMEGNQISPLSLVDLRMQTLASDGEFWMDKGSFVLKIQENY